MTTPPPTQQIHTDNPRVMIVDGFRRAAVIAAVAIFLILLVDFRSFKDALLALLPTALGWGWMIVVMRRSGKAALSHQPSCAKLKIENPKSADQEPTTSRIARETNHAST